MMTQQEQFEADYLAAFPDIATSYVFANEHGRYLHAGVQSRYEVWLQQAKRHEAEKAELVVALKISRAWLHETAQRGGVDQ
jgi:hypothetical protein